ncbi:ubiquitin-like domain-containing protein [Gracilibacillus xinjiangensis]|uniref:Ubiquitin-like domain-containing protein n=1 Tax=Gracilibacillus xinjiangensis TaxID=1193282 RepID=A0ABV8WVR8_9BACI
MKRLLNLPKLLNNKDFVYAVTLLVIIGTISYLFFELSKAEVTVVQEGEEITVRTHANTVEDVLDELAIDVQEHDELTHNLNDTVKTEMTIELTVAKEVIVTEGDIQQTYHTTANTVEAFIEESGIEISEHDHVSLSLNEEIVDQTELVIEKAFLVTINDAGEEQNIWTVGGTVETLLDQTTIELSELDRVSPAKSEEVNAETEIDITRVEKVTDIVEEEVDFTVVKKSNADLQKGKEKVVKEGQKGVVEKHYEVVLENGEEVSRKLVNEEVTKESQEKVVAVGTKVETPPVANTVSNTAASKPATPQAVSRGSGQEVTTLYMKATAYNWNCASCDGRGLTSTGYDLKANPQGVIAVDPSVIPLGTKVWVEGYGYAVARDTGGAIKGNKIDVHMPTLQQAHNFGSRTVQVKIYK